MKKMIDRKGDKAVIGDIAITLPKDMLALSVIGNKLEKGGTITENSLIVSKEGKSRKLYMTHSLWGKYWPGILDCPKLIEKKMRSINPKIKDLEHNHALIREEIAKQVPSTKDYGWEGYSFHAVPYNSRQNRDSYWLYRLENREGIWEWSFKWVNKPEAPIGLLLGQKFYELEHKLHKAYHQKYKHKDMLVYSVERWIRKHMPPPKAGHYQLIEVKVGETFLVFSSTFHTFWEVKLMIIITEESYIRKEIE